MRTYRFNGRVIDASTGLGFAGARVEPQDWENQVVFAYAYGIACLPGIAAALPPWLRAPPSRLPGVTVQAHHATWIT